MARYDGLYEHLRDRQGREWLAGFDQIERVLGSPLPASAYRYPAWWANQSGAGHIQSAAWQRAGWKTARLDLERRRVAFEKQPEETGIAGGETTAEELEIFVDLAADFAGTQDRDQILLTALKSYVERESALALAALGGTMPDFTAPPRRRDAA